MSTYDDIAKRIVNVLVSPDTAIGFMQGVSTVAKDMGYLVRGYMDTDYRYARETEKIRMAYAIKYGVLQNKNFAKTIEVVFNIFNKYIPLDKQNKIYSRTISSVAGRAVTNSIIAGKIATSISQNSSLLVKFRGGVVGNLLLVGGMAERSVYTSQRLKESNPEVYTALRHNNFDLIYFLVEPAVSPFVDALRIKNTQGQNAFNRIIILVDELINGEGIKE